MFSPLFLDYYQNWCAHKKPCSQHKNFDFYIDCNSDSYAIETVRGRYNRVTDIRVLKSNGSHFEPFQKFSACQFRGAFFANLRLDRCCCDGISDIVADVYDACSFPVGKLVLINGCNRMCSSDPCPGSDHHPCSHRWSDNCLFLNV